MLFVLSVFSLIWFITNATSNATSNATLTLTFFQPQIFPDIEVEVMKLWIWWSWLTCSPCSNQFLDSHLISSAIDTTHGTTIIITTTLLSLPLFLLLSQNTFVKTAAVSKKALSLIYTPLVTMPLLLRIVLLSLLL